MNNIEAIIEETKRKSALINSLVIDLQYIQQIMPQVLNNENTKAPDFKNACNALHKMLNSAIENMNELKPIVPYFQEEIEVPNINIDSTISL